jgi:hypothetical protein
VATVTDSGRSVLDEFLRGERDLADATARLEEIAAEDAGAARALRAYVDDLYRAGRLPLQVHRSLLARLGADPAQAAATESAWGEPDVTTVDPTKPLGDSADRTRVVARDDPTRAPARPLASADAPVDPTVDRSMRGGASPPEPMRPAGPAADTSAQPGEHASAYSQAHERASTGARTGGSTDAGSDWSHPERWRSRGGGELGPGSVVKERFLLESVLGRGGMGVVYRALDRRKEEALDRDPYVALKILNDEFRRHPQALIALQREARKAQTLAHPNVITVHDFDRDGTTVYMTMELLEGEPLSSTIKTHKLRGVPRELAVAVIRGIGTALAYAHRKGIVHSDLKPGNVFVTGAGDVKVLDFGIARAVPTALEPDADKTVSDTTELGALTPAYASPEMLQGAPPEPADDVFALGVLAHELLTGRHPFDKLPADQARAQGLKPSADLALPRRQRAALAKALHFERAKRHANAAAFLAHFDGPSPLKRAAYGAVLVALAGVAGYAL